MNLEKPSSFKQEEKKNPENIVAKVEKPRTAPDENITKNEDVVAYKDKVRASLKSLGRDFFDAYQKTGEVIKAEISAEDLALSPYWHAFIGSTGVAKETIFNPEVDDKIKGYIDELASRKKLEENN